MSKLLKDIIQKLPQFHLCGESRELPILIEDITADSREVREGTLFIALAGNSVDGHDYIKQALEKGAVAVLAEKHVSLPLGSAVLVIVPDTREAMQRIVPYYFDYPAHKMRMIAVTGTNGKTTTTYLLRNIFAKAGYNTGVVGTIKAMSGERIIEVKNTTPDVIELQKILAVMLADGVEYVFMEVSSHALSLNRIAGCEFDGAIFTNLTRDHLDFHGDMANYFTAKQMLFSLICSEKSVKSNKWCVSNIDDPVGEQMLSVVQGRARATTVAVDKQADLTAKNICAEAHGTKLTLCMGEEDFVLHLKLSGLFNVYNVLGVVAAALSEGIERDVVMESIQECDGVDGRFELVKAGQNFAVVVDYAHTPDGLENVLRTAREITANRLFVVFGCGGDRDRTKRPIMGRLATNMADVVIATSDNPRTEDPEFILSEIEVGIKEAMINRKNVEYYKIVDRRQGIRKAIMLAKAGDVVLIAGKGHETYQILKTGKIDFDDRLVVADCVRECL